MEQQTSKDSFVFVFFFFSQHAFLLPQLLPNLLNNSTQGTSCPLSNKIQKTHTNLQKMRTKTKNEIYKQKTNKTKNIQTRQNETKCP